MCFASCFGWKKKPKIGLPTNFAKNPPPDFALTTLQPTMAATPIDKDHVVGNTPDHHAQVLHHPEGHQFEPGTQARLVYDQIDNRLVAEAIEGSEVAEHTVI